MRKKGKTNLKKIAAIVGIFAAICILWHAEVFWQVIGKFFYVDNLNKNNIGIARNPEPSGDMKTYYNDQYFSLNDLRWFDCNHFTEEEQNAVQERIPKITFNEDTVFTENIESELQPDVLLECGKTPGLMVKKLHEQGITGKNVGIAIIDQTLYIRHPEYASRIKLYEEMHVVRDETASMHGAGVSSIAVGQNCGVAPEADLYFWAFMNMTNNLKGSVREKDTDWEGYARIIDRVIEVNETLPKDRKIRVISISRGYEYTKDIITNLRVKKMLDAISRAEKAGIFVVTTATQMNYSFMDSEEFAIAGLEKIDPKGDADDVSNYTLPEWEWEFAEALENTLLVPMDGRTTADMSGDTYVYYADGGWSWTVPYVAGLYALCAQVDPDVTPEAFYNNAIKTASIIERTSKDGEAFTFHVVNPQRLVECFIAK